MHQFSKITAEELGNLIVAKQRFGIEVSASITKFPEHIPNENFTFPKEVPPTPAILTKDGIAQILRYGGNGSEGMYMGFVVFVYASGGKIHYTVLPSGDYKAEVTWESALPK